MESSQHVVTNNGMSLAVNQGTVNQYLGGRQTQTPTCFLIPFGTMALRIAYIRFKINLRLAVPTIGSLTAPLTLDSNIERSQIIWIICSGVRMTTCAIGIIHIFETIRPSISSRLKNRWKPCVNGSQKAVLGSSRYTGNPDVESRPL